jgi:cytochrome b561
MNIRNVTSAYPNRKEPIQRFSRLQIAIHWMSALAMLILFASMWAREYIEEYALRVNLFELHRQMGLAILTLFVVRLLVKKFGPKKKPSGPQMGKLEHLAAACSHIALYIMLFAMPVIGWIITNAHGQNVRFLRMFTLPSLVSKNEDLEDMLQLAHEYGAYALMGLIGLHFAAALFHHFVKKDHVLASMIPLIGETAVNESSAIPSHDIRAMETMPTGLE